MTQEETKPQTQPTRPAPAKPPITPALEMDDICARFSISRRQCRTLIRRGVIIGKPKQFYKVKGKDERRPVDWFISRAEFRRLEREGLVPADWESEVSV